MKIAQYLQMINLKVDLDPEIMDIVVEFLGIAGKYALVIGICVFCLKMFIKAATGKARFL